MGPTRTLAQIKKCEYVKLWAKKNKAKVLAWAKRYRDKNKSKVAAKQKLYAILYREKRNATRRKTAEKNKHTRKAILDRARKKAYLKDRPKHRTRRITKTAIQNGKIIKLPCKYCGNVKSQVHHNDYKDPFNVTWMCKKHHDAWHRVFEADI